MDNKYKIILCSISKNSKCTEDIHDETKLVEDLGFDSICFVNMIIAIEEVYNFSFDDDYINIKKLKTVKDIAEYISFKTAKGKKL